MAAPATTMRAVFRSPEDLYSQLPVRDVVRVLAKTKEDAEKKREELRELVGRRYHDLIDSADAIISMNDTVVGFEKMLLTIEASASALMAEPAKQGVVPSNAKRKQDSSISDGSSPRALAAALSSENDRIEFLLRAPSEMWAALESGNDLKAARLLLNAKDIAKHLQLVQASTLSGIAQLDSARLQEFVQACTDLEMKEPLLSICRTIAEKAAEERAASGAWMLRFPFLLSQARLLEDCQRDIVRSASAAFSERQISAERVERAVEALLLIGEISNPLSSLLDARAKAMKNLHGADEEGLFAIAELTSRTMKDCMWMKLRFQSKGADEELNHWMDSVTSPIAKSIADNVCARTSSVSSLASLQRSLKESIRKIDLDTKAASTSRLSDETIFQRLFGSSFTARANFLMNAAHEQILRKVKRILASCGTASDDKRNQAAFQAFSVLEKGLTAVERDAKELRELSESPKSSGTVQWLSELTSWMEQRPTPATARFAEVLTGFLKQQKMAGTTEYETRLSTLSKQAMTSWAESLVRRVTEEVELAAMGLPWSREGRQGSSQVGGWTADPTHGELPSVPSWPVAQLCFTIARELDAVTDSFHRGGPICAESDEKLRKLVGELTWKKLHSIYSALAKDAPGPDGKLQAAFDLEFTCAVLLESPRPPLPFTSGGVDVYACADVLRVRARSFALSSRLLLHSKSAASQADSTSSNVHETKVGGHALLTIVEPVPRFALLPVPQKRTTPARLVNRNSSQSSDSFTTEQSVKTAATSSGVTGVNLGRVLGWLT